MYGKHIKGKYSILKHLDFVALDILALLLSFSLAYLIRFGNLGFVHSESWRGILMVICLIDFMIILFTAPFSSVLRRYGSDELLQTLKQAIRNLIFCSLALYILKCGPEFSRMVIILTYGFYWGVSLCFRMLRKKHVRKLLSSSESTKKIFVVGTRENMPKLLRSINSGFLRQYSVEGICIADGEIGEEAEAQIDLMGQRGEVLVTYRKFICAATLDSFADFVLKNHIDEVFIGVKPSMISNDTYRILGENGKEIHLDIAPMVGFAPEDQYITTVGTYKTLTIGTHTLDGKQMVYMAVKRSLDILFGLLGMIALLPLMVVVKICYLASGDRKSIFYTQTRVGLNGDTFQLYKFRSMVPNAGEILQELLKDPKYKAEWDEKQKFDNDPRITPIGNILRKTSMDEMPQFLNVLKGDMSVIGPRPLVVGELELHHGLQKYNDVKPGITGWWGCNGRSNTTYEERLSLEYFYVENCSLYLDLLCFVKTVVAIFKKDGAQ